MVAPQPPYGQPQQYTPPGTAPGQPTMGIPSEIKVIGVLQLIAGILYLLTFMLGVFLSCGFALLAITPLYGAVVAALEVYNGARALGQNPDPSGFWWKTLPIMGIVSFISGDIYSCIAGIVALILIGKPHVRGWIR